MSIFWNCVSQLSQAVTYIGHHGLRCSTSFPAGYADQLHYVLVMGRLKHAYCEKKHSDRHSIVYSFNAPYPAVYAVEYNLLICQIAIE